MAIDILNIQPHKVSRDLKGYTILFYGDPKTGKTTIASKFPKTLLLAFEKGYSTISGIKPQPINRWSEFKQVLKQLQSDAAKELYDNIIVDTADIAYDYCEKYICNNNDVDTISDLGYGKGYSLARKEFDEALRSIPQMGYGLIMISHAQDKTFKDETGQEYNQIVPTLPNAPRLVVDRMADIIGYAHGIQEEDGSTRTILYMRGTPRFMAGSRFQFTPNSINFTYDALVEALHDAIDKQEEVYGKNAVTDDVSQMHDKPEELNFTELMDEFNELVGKMQEALGSSFGSQGAPRIVEITNKYLGKGKKVADCTASQVEQLSLIIDDIKDMFANGF